jgi:hypothetical protein
LAQGTCIIAADQAGDEFYAAIEATESFPVAATGPVSHALLVSKAGNGTGTLSSSPAGIDCGATCATTFAAGTSVTLTPTPDSGFVFAGWSGACTGFTACTLSMDGVKDVTATFAVAVSIPRLVAIATRGIVLTGNQVMIGGFIIGGASNKTVIVRARGPSLTSAGITDALANPVLQLVLSDGSVITNDDWGSAPNAAAVSASGYAPTDAHESAIMATLPPGGYTAIISGVGGTTGVGLVEVYELDHPEYPLVGIATRGEVLGGNDVLIGGFIIQGDGPQTVIVRARGPSLAAQGVANPLADPILQLISSDGTVVTNYNWTSAPNAAQIQASGFAPGDPRESAILTTLSPGAYTAIVTGGGTVGTAIVEVYRQ